jgi:hypothetical protein
MSGMLLVESAAACGCAYTHVLLQCAEVSALTSALSPCLTGFAPPLERLPLLSWLSHALTRVLHAPRTY